MSERSILLASRIGAAIVLALTLALAAGLVLLVGCATSPPGPGPLDPPTPQPAPAATCQSACAHAVQLRCTSDSELCEQACSRYAELGGDSGWNLVCWRDAQSCQQIETCRGSQP